ncbi:MAG: acyl-[Alphaproteobacteria bacterium]|nr:acyl-[ACP]--phospholipid O-acyltransferase [Alphaproteobacteria bacterium]
MAENILKSRRFLPLLITQFLGAFNDNLFKNALLMAVTLQMASKAALVSNVIAALFIFPFFLFSALAGEIADKYDKAAVARVLKFCELLMMIMAMAVYHFESLWGLIALLGAMGVQSAFFGPVKYSLLPTHLTSEELALGNAYVEATTYVAILLGLILGTVLPITGVMVLLILMAFVGFCSSLFILKAEPERKNAIIHTNIFSSTAENLKLIYHHKVVFKCVLGATWFWMIGAFVVVQIYPLSGHVLNVTNTVITFFLVLFSIGVACGSVFCGHLMKGLIHTTYIPLSVLMMGLCFYALYFLTAHYQTPLTPVSLAQFLIKPESFFISLSIFVMAFFGGLYIVPLNTLMQNKAPKAFLATIIGGNNILNALGMVLMSLLTIALLALGFTISELFLAVAVLSLFVFIYTVRLLPNAFWRSVLRAVLEVLFRIEVKGAQNLRRAGKSVLLVSNHTSLLDGLLIAAFTEDELTFAVNTGWAEKWFMKLFKLFVHFAPLNPTNPMSMRSLIADIKKGKRVMIFPEGRISTTGGLMKIYEGAGLIAHKANARVVRLRIDGAQFSKLSYLKHKNKTRCFPKITLTFLRPQKLTVSSSLSRRAQRHQVSLKLYDMMTEMMYVTSNINEHLFVSLLKAAKQHGLNHKIAEDVQRRAISYKTLLKKVYVLGTAFEYAFDGQENVGLMLPNCLADLACFYALECVDKVPVMLNFSLGEKPFLSMLQTLELQTIITSREFIEKARLMHLIESAQTQKANVVYLEDFAKKISLKIKIKGLLRYLIGYKPKNEPSRPAAALFTSGSEGLPKAVILSHVNLQANRYQLTNVLSVNASDVFFNALPMFHSFGLSIGAVATILSGIKTFLYPSPLHYRIVPELVYDTNATIVCGTDTFFYGYGRMGHPYDFFNVKYAIVGGEKLKERTALVFMKKFGVRILEGYGTTETAPVLALNTPMNAKEGTVGRLLPCIAYQIKKTEGVSNGGELWVKGDNVMLGYIKPQNPNKIEPLENGWYATGDIVSVDEDGFVKILGRMKRFAKIGGEMVSLTAVEEALEKLYPDALQGVVFVSDEKKGEKLVLITNRQDVDLSAVKAFFKTEGLSELCLPKEAIYMKNPPMLASGKMDYQAISQKLEEHSIGLV